ncbi:MAG: flagellar filament capping protein FliD [Lachnospiraceae bacterium]|nr:flagellar filament capping protein FliD [Lachnospiraceae bacterium]
MPIRLSGMVSGLDTESLVKELISSYNVKKESYEKNKTKLEWKQEKWQEINAKIYKLYSGSLSNLRMSKAYNSKKTIASDETKASVIAASNAIQGSQSLEVLDLASTGYLTGADLKGDYTTASKLLELGITADTSITLTVNGETKEIALTPDMTINQFTETLKAEGLNASFDANNQRFFVSSKESGKAADFELSGDMAALSALGLDYNNAEFKSTSNNFSINGLTIEVKEKTTSAITLSTSTDVDAIYDTIKGFVKEYNELIKELDTIYGADSAKGYEPLTSEEKEAMSEDDIEKWEKKIKDSLLRRDNTVGTLSSMLKNTMQSTYEINGTKYSLSSFGIGTLGYFTSSEFEKGVFHIDGDPDDASSSGNDDKLKAMIASDPEAVGEFFKNLASDLYTKVGEKMQATQLSSAFTVYNDKQMTTELTDLKKKISDWEDYVTEQEDYWYKKFAAMEKAMSELQANSSYLSGLLGTPQ